MLGALVAAGVLFRALYYGLGASYLKLVGDEQFYYSGSADLITLIGSFGTPEAAEAADRIIGNGWFMPGMSFVLMPMRLLTDDLGSLRLYVGVLNLVLLGSLIARVDHMFGRRAALLLTGLAGGFPILVSFSFVFWGQLFGMLLTLLLFLHLSELDARIEQGLTVRHGATIGAVLVVVVYLRPNMILVVPLVLATVLMQHLAALRVREALPRLLRFALPLVTVFTLGIAPWSAALSARMGGFFLTTTSLKLNQITAYVPTGTFKEATGLGKSAHSADDHVRAVMDETGLGYKRAMDVVADDLLADLTFAQYQDAVQLNAWRYFCSNSVFPDRSARLIKGAYPPKTPAREARVAFLHTLQPAERFLWYPLLFLFLGFVLVPLTVPGRVSISIALKGLFWTLAIQPFASAVNWQHYVALVPVILLAAAIAVGRERPRLLRLRDCRTPSRRLEYAGHLLSAGLLLAGIALLSIG